MGESDYEEADDYDEEGAAALAEFDNDQPAAKVQKVVPQQVAPQQFVPQGYRGPLAHQINRSEEDEIRRLEGAPPPSIDLTNDDAPSDPAMDCPCGIGQCSVFTAKTERNMGRKFFRCPEIEGGCQFFKWCDEAQPASGSSSYSAPAPGQQTPGGFATDAYAPEPAMACPCGLGQCSVLTAKTEKNFGKKFFKCPVRDGGCNFFQWCDDAQSSGASRAPNDPAPRFGSGGGYANGQANSFGSGNRYGGQGQTGRYASSANPTAGGGGSGSGGGGRGSCFKCGREGHWSRDCPQGAGGGGGGRGSGGGGGECYKCGQGGHWARDCPGGGRSGGRGGGRGGGRDGGGVGGGTGSDGGGSSWGARRY